MINLPVTLQSWGKNRVTANTVQGESGSRSLTVTFLGSNGQPVDLTGSSPRMYIADTNPPVFTDGIIIDAANGIARFVLTSDMTAQAGLYACQFLLSGPEVPALKFTGLTLSVAASDLENAVEASNEFSALTAALGKAEDAAAQAGLAVTEARQSSVSAESAAAAAAAAKCKADSAAAQVKNAPEIGADGYWYFYNAESGRYEKSDKSALLLPKGTWVAGTYGKNEYVYYPPDNAVYCSLTDGNTNTPSNDGANWMLLCRGSLTDNNFTDAYKALVDAAVPDTRRVAGLPLSADLTPAQIIAAGFASGDGSGSAQNALKLGGVDAADFPQISSGTWTPTLYGLTTAGAPTYTTQTGHYVRIGKLAAIYGRIVLSSKGGMAGVALIGGLPFPAASGFVGGSVCFHFAGGYTLPSGILQGEIENIYVAMENATPLGTAVIDVSALSDDFTAYFTGLYVTN